MSENTAAPTDHEDSFKSASAISAWFSFEKSNDPLDN